MYRYFFIAKNNMKKQKGDMITFFVMTFMASLMLFICLNLLAGTFRVLNTNKETINGADILVLMNDNSVIDFKLQEILQGDEKYDGIEQNKYLSVYAKYKKKGVKEWSEYPFHIACYDEDRKIHTTSIETKKFSGKDIVVPISLSTSYKIGDTLILKISDNEYEFRIAGFNEDFIYSSPMNFGTYLCYISEDMYEDLEYENPTYVGSYKLTKVNLSEKAKNEKLSASDLADDMYNDLKLWFQSYQDMHPEIEGFSANFVPSDLMMTATMIMPFMFISIILVFAVLVLTIALVVIDFSVKNFIIDNMKNTGIMEAGGYTVKEMMFILLLQLLIVSGAGSTLGAVLGALLQGKIGYIMLFLVGLSWNQSADIGVLIGVIVGICAIIAVFALILGRQYKKTSVLDALRGGINTHNYKRNVFPFDKTNFPIFVTIALKETFGKFKNQIGVIVIMAVLSFCGAMGFGMYENMGKDVNALLRISGIDMQDASTSGDVSMVDTINSFECVKNVLYETWTALDYTANNKTKTVTTRAISDTSLLSPDLMVEGRWPKYENEVALGTMACDGLGVKVGDTIVLKNGEESASYLVVGVMQTFNNMGMMGYLTKDGYERVGRFPSEASISVNLKKGYTFKDLEKEFKDVFPDTEIVDQLSSTGNLFTILKVSMQLILAIIMVVTGFITALAEALLIRSRITKDWRNLGVNKALGFTSNQLILQVMLSNIPAILIGIAIGMISVTFLGGKVLLLMFAIFGFRNVPFGLSPIAYISVITMIIGVALAVSWLIGKRIKKLEPVKMITEE